MSLTSILQSPKYAIHIIHTCTSNGLFDYISFYDEPLQRTALRDDQEVDPVFSLWVEPALLPC